jgi:hypothetical protein
MSSPNKICRSKSSKSSKSSKESEKRELGKGVHATSPYGSGTGSYHLDIVAQPRSPSCEVPT